MNVLRSGQLLAITRTTGPAHNFLGLDFADGAAPYVKDLAQSEGAMNLGADSVRQQVEAAAAAHRSDGDSLPSITGILFVSTDTPSDSVYRLLANEIFASLSRLEELDPFEPHW